MKLVEALAALKRAGWVEHHTRDGHRVLVAPGGGDRIKVSWGNKGGRNAPAPPWLTTRVRRLSAPRGRI